MFGTGTQKWAIWEGTVQGVNWREGVGYDNTDYNKHT